MCANGYIVHDISHVSVISTVETSNKGHNRNILSTKDAFESPIVLIHF